jgi:hypothetical protein
MDPHIPCLKIYDSGVQDSPFNPAPNTARPSYKKHEALEPVSRFNHPHL